MCDTVWCWARKPKKTDENLEIDKWQISAELKMLWEDSILWIKNETYFQKK
jgi:hypothetical protein